jgi:hypothetical protein
MIENHHGVGAIYGASNLPPQSNGPTSVRNSAKRQRVLLVNVNSAQKR